MPAEWEEHRATWVSWPKNPDTFQGDVLRQTEEAYSRMVGALAEGEEVRVMVDDESTEARAKSQVATNGNVVFHRVRTVDVWVRDYGPLYLVGKDVALTKWVFNAWGRKYEDLLPDNDAGEFMAESEGLRVFRPGMVLEGGSIDVDGGGTLLTTEQCLMNPNRNPGLPKLAIEEKLRANLGATRVVWLEGGIDGDDTDGHVDDVARFVGPAKVVVSVESDPSDANHSALERNRAILDGAITSEGQQIEVIPLPMPPRVDSAGGRLPVSHANFYIGNSVVLVPTFGGGSDRKAVSTLAGLFPDREVLGIDCRALAHGLGTIHCVTQQVPADP
ncbi:MAG: agmatine deiminase family protein [Thaumarchaeota archaeon]|nr:agmatine deiminase family protein [Nitrososphaerota archaeon]